MGFTWHRRIFTTGLAEAKATFSSRVRRFLFALIPQAGNPVCMAQIIPL
jgi:hypothetical protein